MAPRFSFQKHCHTCYLAYDIDFAGLKRLRRGLRSWVRQEDDSGPIERAPTAPKPLSVLKKIDGPVDFTSPSRSGDSPPPLID
jgi:hypothetical protein